MAAVTVYSAPEDGRKGLPKHFYNLVKSYLGGRYQKVSLDHNNSIESTWEEIKQGVPQGSILGPIFFPDLYK